MYFWEVSLFYPTDSLEISKNVRKPKNHEAARLAGLTAEIIKVGLDVICDRLTYQRIIIKWCFPENFENGESGSNL